MLLSFMDDPSSGGAHATGVRIKGADGTEDTTFFAADVVLCNADLPAAEESLLPPSLSRAAQRWKAGSMKPPAAFRPALPYCTRVLRAKLPC